MIVGRNGRLGNVASLMMIAGLIWGADIVFDAAQVHYANQRRCLSLEADMLGPAPKRANAPDVYQALGCEPQPEAVQRLLKAPVKK